MMSRELDVRPERPPFPPVSLTLPCRSIVYSRRFFVSVVSFSFLFLLFPHDDNDNLDQLTIQKGPSPWRCTAIIVYKVLIPVRSLARGMNDVESVLRSIP